ncbi:MAG TPA: PhzF family phenazine biosynthesis protein [Actinomycetota bacterium]|nr:PhzF family phenazine biosynthesis protein [Actinomycetota bacterium]
MNARYVLVDVFARAPLEGNGLAVFPDPGSVDQAQMQKIAREMNLSETTFVTGVNGDGYDVRIFTPSDELPFAGHPTLGTSWVLRRHLGALEDDEITQRSAAGETRVTFDAARVWLARSGSDDGDLDDVGEMLSLLGISEGEVGFDARAIGGQNATLRPAITDIGVEQLMLPVSSPEIVAGLRAPTSVPYADGVYCFAPLGEGRVKARFFAPGIGVSEDPATGSAATGLGVYLGTRAGDLDIEIEQGAEIARPSFISVQAPNGSARVGGEVRLVTEATLHA